MFQTAVSHLNYLRLNVSYVTVIKGGSVLFCVCLFVVVVQSMAVQLILLLLNVAYFIVLQSIDIQFIVIEWDFFSFFQLTVFQLIAIKIVVVFC